MADFFEYVRDAARAAGYDIDSPRGGGKKALAEKAGLSYATVSRMLAGTTIPEPASLARLADVLGVPRNDLLNLAGVATDEHAETPRPAAEARFAEWLKAVRGEDGMTQREIAEALNAQGFTAFRQTTIAKIEGGDRPILLAEAVAMAELFGTTLDVALGLRPGKARERVDAQILARRTRVLQQIQKLAEVELGGDA